MTSAELRKKFLEFFEKNGHKIVASSSLIPTDPSVLFTTAGMQQFKPYYLGEKSPFGLNVATCQKCFRTSDIEEVGDERHLTFFEMLGNFSFGGYGKKEAIELAKKFLDLINIKIDYVTVFAGDERVPRDEESAKIWEKLDFSEKKGNLKFFDSKENFWGPTGEEGPCGPTTEIYSQGVEIWNLVFNEYYQDRNKNLTESSYLGIDTGMGLERLAKVSQSVPTIFETDLFSPLTRGIQGEDERVGRIIADHVKAAVFLISEGILPSNVERGYVLRRILRRAIRYGKLLGEAKQLPIPLAQKVIEVYQDIYLEVKSKKEEILQAIQNEEEKFEKTLEEGLKELKKLEAIGGLAQRVVPGVKIKAVNRVDAKAAFYIYQTFGFPIELIQEELVKKMLFVDEEEFQEELKKHQEISRAGAEKKFGGHNIGAVGSEKEREILIRLHTATHLLHAALRQVLGNNVQQMGSDITTERTRFDFSHPSKMTPEEIKKVEDSVNEKIKEDLEVKKEEMKFDEAIKAGALAFFKEKYPEVVNVYSINGFSKEVCGGPHVSRTAEIGKIKIIKEESSAAGIRRIRAILVE